MEFTRAQEIVNSTESITVFHNGQSVWIEGLDPKNQTAMVKTVSQHMTVSVTELQEVH